MVKFITFTHDSALRGASVYEKYLTLLKASHVLGQTCFMWDEIIFGLFCCCYCCCSLF